MPVRTLGFVEVEQRLRLVRRRLNLLGLQHALFLSGSVILAALTLLILLALRGESSTFRVGFWMILGGVALCTLCAFVALWQRWKSFEHIVRLADRRAHLDDRLTTLFATHARAPWLETVLLNQLLAQGARWDTSALVPRRVPRSAYVFAVSLLALALTGLIERPPERPPADVPGHSEAPDALVRAPAVPRQHEQRGQNSQDPLAGLMPTRPTETHPSAPRGSGLSLAFGHANNVGAEKREGFSQTRAPSGSRERTASPGTSGHDGADTGEALRDAVPSRIQHAIEKTFRADSVAGSQTVADTDTPAGNPTLPGVDGQPLNGHTSPPGGDQTSADGKPQQQRRGLGDDHTVPATSPVGSAAGGQRASAHPALEEPGELFADHITEGRGNADAKAFTLTLSTLFQNAPTEFEPPRRSRSDALPSTVAPGTVPQPAQLGEDPQPVAPVQKPLVPTEHEAMLKRIFTRGK